MISTVLFSLVLYRDTHHQHTFIIIHVPITYACRVYLIDRHDQLPSRAYIITYACRMYLIVCKRRFPHVTLIRLPFLTPTITHFVIIITFVECLFMKQIVRLLNENRRITMLDRIMI